MTKVLPCDCITAADIVVKSAGTKSDFRPVFKQRSLPTAAVQFQDKRYGHGNRLHNQRHGLVMGKLKLIGHTCTICGKKKSLD